MEGALRTVPRHTFLPGTSLEAAYDTDDAPVVKTHSDGVLIVPLRMNGITRVVAFRRDGDHLASNSAEICGFVPMQGTGEHHDRTFFLPDGDGHRVKVRFDVHAPEDPGVLDGVLAIDAGLGMAGRPTTPR